MARINNVGNVEHSKNLEVAGKIITKENNVKQFNNPQQVRSTDQGQRISVDEALKILEEKIKKLSELFRGEAQFTFDKEIDRVIIKIKDKETGEIIRQIPPEVAVKIAKKVDELIGILFDELA